MATTLRSDIPRLLLAGIKEIMRKNLEAQKKSYYETYSSKKTSDKAAEYYDTIGNISPATVVPEATQIPYNTIKQGYRVTVTNLKVANGLKVSIEAKDDDLYNVLDMAQHSALIRTMNSKKERDVAAIWNTTLTATGGDGVAPSANNHPLINSASVNNNTMTGAITPDNVVTGCNMFNDILDQAGELFDTEATQILAHSNQMARIMAILESTLKAYELSNTKNTVPVVKPVLSRYLDKTLWHLRDETIDSVIYQERMGLTPEVERDAISEYVYKTNYIARYAASMINPGYGFVTSSGT